MFWSIMSDLRWPRFIVTCSGLLSPWYASYCMVPLNLRFTHSFRRYTCHLRCDKAKIADSNFMTNLTHCDRDSRLQLAIVDPKE